MTTQSQLLERVEHWRSKIAPEWRITVVRKPPKEALDPDENPDRYEALVDTDIDYLHAALWVRADYLEKAKPHELDLAIAHEMVHLHYVRARNVLDRLYPVLGEVVHSQARETFIAEEERGVDRLSRIIVGADLTGTVNERER